ncbi:MFS transporter [Kistimonas asteriae]|uniref:MFS transporter n=1 Tax=Kistimonas asteriae TaxID=517724 RepID=UPI001BA799DC|nr:MFS transporter [Kistimonas asteriae]
MASMLSLSPGTLKILSAAGSTLEFYDFTLFILFAPQIAANFFPAESGWNGILPVMLLFAVGYIIRPLGGLLFGHISDRHGRRTVFLSSITCMSLATLSIGLLPDYQTISSFAPCLLLVLRVIQGISLGGELPGAIVYSAEHAPANRRGGATGLVIAGVTFGNVMGSLSGVLLYSVLSDVQINQWGWRLPFIVGGILGIAGYYWRRKFTETPVFQAAISGNTPSALPLKILITRFPTRLIRGLLIASVPASLIAVLLFIPRYRQHYLHNTGLSDFTLTTVLFLLICLNTVIFAHWSDKTGRRPILFTGLGLLTVSALPLWSILLHAPDWSYVIALLTLPFGMIMSCYETMLVELFPTEVRTTGVACCHNLAFALIGGLTPALLESLCQQGLLSSPAWILTACSLTTVVAVFGLNDRYRQPLASLAAKSR